MQNSYFRTLLSSSSGPVSAPASASTTDDGKESAARKKNIFGARVRGGGRGGNFLLPRNIDVKARSREPGHSTSQNDIAGESNGVAGVEGPPQKKKLKSSSVPKGSRIADGYVDRARKEGASSGGGRRDEEEEGQPEIRRVKGLDFEALARARRGETDVDGDDAVAGAERVNETSKGEKEELDVDGELEEVLKKDVVAQVTMKTDQDVLDNQQQQEVQQVLARNEILARLKQDRTRYINPTLAASTAPILDQSKFKKLQSNPQPGKRKYTETINGWRREVLVITSQDGTTKRKTRWLDAERKTDIGNGGVASEVRENVWGGDLPEEVLARQRAQVDAAQKSRREEEEEVEEEEEEEDIFGGVGEYDPLAAIGDEEDEENDEEDEAIEAPIVSKTHSKIRSEAKDEVFSTAVENSASARKRNYFDESTSASTTETKTNTKFDASKDPQILAALGRAVQLRRAEEAQNHIDTSKRLPNSSTEQSANSLDTQSEQKNKALLARLQKQSGAEDDLLDVDYDGGFGGSRYDDDDDDDAEEGKGKVKLSQWRGLDGTEHEDDGGHEDGAKGKKKKANDAKGRRNGKKNKRQDKDSFKDIMGVLEQRKGKSSLL